MTERTDDPQLNSNGPTASALEANARLLALRSELAAAGQLRARADVEARPVAGDRRRLPRVERGGLDVGPADVADGAAAGLDQGARPADGGAARPSGPISWSIRNDQKNLEDRRRAEGRRYGAYGPAAAGWVWPASQDGPGRAETAAAGESIAVSAESGPPGRPEGAAGRVAGDGDDPTVAEARIAPALAAACLSYENGRIDSCYQLYEAARAVDVAGRGGLPLARLLEVFTRKESPLYRYGRRRAQDVLARGEGLFWHRAKSRGEVWVWLHSRARVAARLGVRLSGHDVMIPLRKLIPSGTTTAVKGRKGDTRSKHANANAVLYAAVHAGRVKQVKADRIVKAAYLALEGAAPTVPAGPITRDNLRKAAGVSKYRQRSYERRARVQLTANLRLSPAARYDDLDQPRRGGSPVYRFIDRKGLHGPAGATWDARRLGNSYRAPDPYRAVFSQRTQKLNARSLYILRIDRKDAGCKPALAAGPEAYKAYERLFYEDAKAADRAHRKDGGYVLWRAHGRRRGRIAVYHALGIARNG